MRERKEGERGQIGEEGEGRRRGKRKHFLTDTNKS